MSRLTLVILSVVVLGIIARIEYSLFFRASDSCVINDSKYISWKETLIDSVGIPEPAINLAFNGYLHLKHQNLLRNDSLLTIIDFSRPSIDKRLFILDLRNERIVKNTLVAHGMNTGGQDAESFSNEMDSNKSSLGLFITQGTYEGKHGYSLRIKGMSKGLNDNVFKRAIVIHGADYVSDSFIKQTGRLGRSFGCPALPLDETKEVIDLIKDGTCLYIYHPVLIPITQSDLEKLP
ncbi:MAG: hypothetical protein A2W99_17415 [Bacteroidetes bacterium GWF2_33_16]|nr:MAG: hypothetical protein A2X00_14555 [Bacteroidetes bacterium GWE2_32_14]OFY06818.1 MAG: hypothetical protein A2W99_17415 [Bacteroidetes bacterium GWF2_33_16]